MEDQFFYGSIANRILKKFDFFS